MRRLSPRAAPEVRRSTRDNPLVSATVGALTEGLRLAGVGASEYRAASAAAPPAPPLRRGDVRGLLRELRADYGRQYFVTGLVSDRIYTEDCLFADPTISFRGVDRYKRNLALLVPFFWDAKIELRTLRELPGAGGDGLARWRALLPWMRGGTSGGSNGGSGGSGGQAQQQQRRRQQQQQQQQPVRLLAEWRLTCWLRLPWAPYICVNGTTTYTLNEASNQIESHVEAWDVSATQALLLLLRPSERAAWRRNGGAGAAPPPVAARLRPSLGLLMHATLLVAPQLALHAHLGSLWLNFAIAAGALLLLYKLVTFPRWSDEMRHAPRFALSVCFLLGVSSFSASVS
ncbi:Adenine phosphoribosyltransferase 1, chloroplastic [Micractinium conductrix]|uniref:Adenine phosphoribosyltransferase 1, chloroplastic n=1 Tax=Micractinium conductrix TaxID=554055 RepID=A0A2P6VMJ7_9CHLO|nr:Adenine phosphoribosyltransferase 1, chloroplastic [Micractinium conductrix]|eukprot:PSC75331.1 Adenine phosphoribosyltransferase 1, chloroplastic [Micractinium conductrix]